MWKVPKIETKTYIYKMPKVIYHEHKVLSAYNSTKHILTSVDIISKNDVKSYNSENLINYYIPKQQKLKLNILYYDESLIENMNASDYCAYLQMNIQGTFYGCHNLFMFYSICNKIKKSDRDFILISSGSSFEKIYEFIKENNKIREYYIYCYNIEKYKNLQFKYSKLKGIYNDYKQLNNHISTIIPTKINEGYKSSNVIFFEDYAKIYIKLHFEIIRKYALYKLLKDKNYDENKFLSLVSNAFPKFINIAKQLFPDKDEIINFFQKNIDKNEDISGSLIANVFNKNDSIENFISNYTAESFYYRYLNKFLREGDFDSFRILSSHISKFIYYLYDYQEKDKTMAKNATLYRNMYISKNDFSVYKNSIGRTICYPSFTSTSIKENNFFPKQSNNNYVFVKLIIEQNYSKSVISIKKYSMFASEEEYLFLPFSFFKILKIKEGYGTPYNPNIVYLKAVYSEKPIEKMFLDFFENYTDNLDAEGLDLIELSNNGESIKFHADFCASLKTESALKKMKRSEFGK